MSLSRRNPYTRVENSKINNKKMTKIKVLKAIYRFIEIAHLIWTVIEFIL